MAGITILAVSALVRGLERAGIGRMKVSMGAMQ